MFIDEGRSVICMRVKSVRPTRNGGWIHTLQNPVTLPTPVPSGEPKPQIDWTAKAVQYSTLLGEARRHDLAGLLRLPVRAFEAMPLLGHSAADPGGECWTFPEVDASGTVIGINRRYRDGAKKVMAGGHRGLTLVPGWSDVPGPVFVVEGPTDTTAMSHAGLCCVGRPSNVGGVGHLANLFRRLPLARPILVVGENDRKPEGLWPGRDGATTVAEGLQRELNREVLFCLPPEDVKDVRDWLTSDTRRDTPWADRGRELRERLEAISQSVSRPALAEPARSDRAHGRQSSGSTLPEFRPFPVECLPPVMREFVEAVAASVGCDPSFVGPPALTVAGAVVGASVVISPKRAFKEPPALWCCTVGDSGTGKSPAMKPFADLIFAIGKQLKADHAERVKDYERALETWEETEKRTGEDRPRKPVREYFGVIDTTIERLIEMLGSSPRGLVILRDELDGWFGSFTKYARSASESDVPQWLSMFDAGPLSYHRRAGEPRDVECDRGFVAVFGGIQPDVLKRTLATPGYIESGLAARILFAMPPKSCPLWSDAEIPEALERQFADLLARLRHIPLGSPGKPIILNLTPGAKARFRELNDEFARAAEDRDGGPMAAILPKAIRYAIRFALIWHLVNETANGRNPTGQDVTVEAMKAGEALARWFVGEAERVYAMLSERDGDRDTRRLCEWVGRKGGRVRARDLQRSNAHRYPNAQVAEAALESLVAAGVGLWVDDRPTSAGGRPSRIFVLQPAVRRPTQADEEGLEAQAVREQTYASRADGTYLESAKQRTIGERIDVPSDFVGCRTGDSQHPSDEVA